MFCNKGFQSEGDEDVEEEEISGFLLLNFLLHGAWRGRAARRAFTYCRSDLMWTVFTSAVSLVGTHLDQV